METSPFPGVDPYIEAQGHWPDFHTAFLTYCRDALDDRLPGAYVARMEEQIRLCWPDDSATIRADVAVSRRPASASPITPEGGVATLAPVIVPVFTSGPEEIRDVGIEIRRLPDLELITVVELLSPSNKAGDGRADYLAKRRALFERPVHLVEIDLLLGGPRLPMQGPLPPGDAYTIVSRSGRRPDAEVYAWSLADPLPTIPVPLAEPDPDIPLDLAPGFANAYRRGRYARLLRYDRPFPPTIAPDRRDWVEGILWPGRDDPSRPPR